MTSRERNRFIIVAVLAAVGGVLLAVIIATFWMTAGDDLAYWIAGNRLATGVPIYAPPELAFEPFAYHYPPPLAQLLAPITLVLPALAYAVAYRSLMLLALWVLAGRRMVHMLAFIAFLPMAVAVRIENVEIFMALGIVLGLRRWPWLFTVAALVKVSPGLGIVYLALQRRWRDVGVSVLLGAVVVVVSYVAAPDLWREWLATITGRADVIGNSIVPLPYSVRALIGFVLTVAAGLIGRRTGELLLVVAMTIANPGLSLQAFALLAAAVPIWLAGPDGLLGRSGSPRDERPGAVPAVA